MRQRALTEMSGRRRMRGFAVLGEAHARELLRAGRGGGDARAA